MNKILDKLGVSQETIKLTTAPKKEKQFTSFDNVATQNKPDLNHQCDLITLIKDRAGYRYLLVVVDISTREIDFEPMKTKRANECLDALKTIYKRKWLNKPKFSMATDQGSEFKSVFATYLQQNNIYKKESIVNNHTQQAVVERANRQLVKLIYAYVNEKERTTEKEFYEWREPLPLIREELNKHRKRKIDKNNDPFDKWFTMDKKDLKKKLDKIDNPKFKVGDMVHVKLEVPTDFIGRSVTGNTKREGDVVFSPKKYRIEKLVYPEGNVLVRYMIEGQQHRSYPPEHLKR